MFSVYVVSVVLYMDKFLYKNKSSFSTIIIYLSMNTEVSVESLCGSMY